MRSVWVGVVQVNALGEMSVVWVKSVSAGTPVPAARESNPTSRAAVVVAGLAIVTVIIVSGPLGVVVAVIERNWSLFGVVVEVTYSVGMV